MVADEGGTPLVLIAHAQQNTLLVLRTLFERDEFAVVTAQSGRAALDLLHEHVPAALLLDRALPGVDALDICRSLRSMSSDPVIFLLGGQADELFTLMALGAGADDCLTLPIHPRELLARVRNTLRRVRGRGLLQSAIIRHSGVEIFLDERCAQVAGQRVDLTTLEFELLVLFVQHPGRVFSREELMRRLRHLLRGEPLDRSMDVHVSNLRRKLRSASPDAVKLETVRGAGYRLGGDHTKRPEADHTAYPAVGPDLALAALRRSPTPTIVLSADRTVVLYNDAARALCGWSIPEIEGKVKCFSLLGCHSASGELLCNTGCVLRHDVLGKTAEIVGSYTITLKDGREVPVHAQYNRLDASGGRGYTLLTLQPESPVATASLS